MLFSLVDCISSVFEVNRIYSANRNQLKVSISIINWIIPADIHHHTLSAKLILVDYQLRITVSDQTGAYLVIKRGGRYLLNIPIHIKHIHTAVRPTKSRLPVYGDICQSVILLVCDFTRLFSIFSACKQSWQRGLTIDCRSVSGCFQFLLCILSSLPCR